MLNRNAESVFARIPEIDAPRSIFDRSHSYTSTADFGSVIPVFCEEVLPGDTWSVKSAKVIRLQTLLTPVMSNAYADLYFFYCPNTILWTHWKEFLGENTSSAWVPQVQYTVPTISAPSQTGFASGTIADYLTWPIGVPWTNSDEQAPIALPLRAYAMICDSYFRDQNLTDPLNIPLGDSNQTGSNGSNYINDVANGGKPFVAAKYHDYFTSAMKSPQKASNPVTVPLGAMAPVSTADVTNWRSIDYKEWVKGDRSAISPLFWYDVTADSPFASATTITTKSSTGETVKGTGGSAGSNLLVPANLMADLTGATGVTINTLRLCFQLQRYYERLAMSGSRMVEQIKAFFGVTVPDLMAYRPEYLGGNRVPLNVSAVTNTAQTATDFLGDLGAKSETADIHADFTHSFSLNGWIIGVLVLRYEHAYSQGLAKQFKRKTLTQYYNPVFQQLGAQPIFTDELYADATNMATADVFAYQEAWSEYRFALNKITGEMRPGISNTLASWHFGDYYTQAPTFSDTWIREDKTNVDRTLAVTSSVSNQAFFDFWFDCKVTRCMPIYSVPGLIDHH